MTKRDLLAMALKALGLFYTIREVLFILSALTYVPITLHLYLNQQDLSRLLLEHLFGPLPVLALALILMGCGDYIARKAIQEDGLLSFIDTQEWEREILTITVIFLGFVCLMWSGPDLVSNLINAVFRIKHQEITGWTSFYIDMTPGLHQSVIPNKVAGTVYLIKDSVLILMGIYLIKGQRQLVEHALRHSSTTTHPEESLSERGQK